MAFDDIHYLEVFAIVTEENDETLERYAADVRPQLGPCPSDRSRQFRGIPALLSDFSDKTAAYR